MEQKHEGNIRVQQIILKNTVERCDFACFTHYFMAFEVKNGLIRVKKDVKVMLSKLRREFEDVKFFAGLSKYWRKTIKAMSKMPGNFT